MKKNILLIAILSIFLSSCQPYLRVRSSSIRIQAGDSITFKWQSRHIDSLKILKPNTELDLNGTISLIPDTTCIFKFSATKKGNVVKTKKKKITVLFPEIEYTALPVFTTDEKPVFINWTTENAEFVEIENYAKNLPPKGSYSLLLDSSQTITLKARNKNNYSSKIEIPFKITRMEYIKGSTLIANGCNTTIRWKFNNTEKVQIEGYDTIFYSRGRVIMTPSETTTYNFKIYRKNGSIETKTHKIVVVPINSIRFSCPAFASQGDEIKVKWEINGASNIYVNDNNYYGKKLKPIDNLTFNLVHDTIITLSFTYNKEKLYIEQQIMALNRGFFNGNIKKVNSLKKDEEINFDIIAIDTKKYPDSVSMKILVTDNEGNFISGLKEYEGRKQYLQQIVEYVDNKIIPVNTYTFREISETKAPSNIAIVLDCSGSMIQYIGLMKEAVEKLINKKCKEDSISIVYFSDNIVRVSPLSTDKNRLLNFLNKAYINSGSSAVIAGTDEGIKTLENAVRNKIVILISDGYENSSFQFNVTHAVTPSKLLKNAILNSSKFFTISCEFNNNFIFLNIISRLTGGNSYFFKDKKKISNVLTEILKSNKVYYEISFVPTIASDPDRRIELEYDNNTGKQIVVQREISVKGIDYYLNNNSFNTERTVLDTLLTISKKIPLSKPQVLVLFDLDSDEILPEYYRRIDKYVEYLNNNPMANAILFGHSDLSGAANYCRRISEKRAQSVKKYLINSDILSKRIKTVACSRSFPRWSFEVNETQKHENRRVDIVIVK